MSYQRSALVVTMYSIVNFTAKEAFVLQEHFFSKGFAQQALREKGSTKNNIPKFLKFQNSYILEDR